jgi:hypothetical protein
MGSWSYPAYLRQKAGWAGSLDPSQAKQVDGQGLGQLWAVSISPNTISNSLLKKIVIQTTYFFWYAKKKFHRDCYGVVENLNTKFLTSLHIKICASS